ncbi:transcription and mRNA export factor ENY2 [Sorex araneus]|nr:transcription and mRNA export factor ENY2 [Sorex araneus]
MPVVLGAGTRARPRLLSLSCLALASPTRARGPAGLGLGVLAELARGQAALCFLAPPLSAAVSARASARKDVGTGRDSPSARVSKMNKDAQMRAAINQKLIETGERERLKELLRAKLIECGWKDQLKAHCKDNDFK